MTELDVIRIIDDHLSIHRLSSIIADFGGIIWLLALSLTVWRKK